jgi:hypothetical protein
MDEHRKIIMIVDDNIANLRIVKNSLFISLGSGSSHPPLPRESYVFVTFVSRPVFLLLFF